MNGKAVVHGEITMTAAFFFSDLSKNRLTDSVHFDML